MPTSSRGRCVHGSPAATPVKIRRGQIISRSSLGQLDPQPVAARRRESPVVGAPVPDVGDRLVLAERDVGVEGADRGPRGCRRSRPRACGSASRTKKVDLARSCGRAAADSGVQPIARVEAARHLEHEVRGPGADDEHRGREASRPAAQKNSAAPSATRAPGSSTRPGPRRRSRPRRRRSASCRAGRGRAAAPSSTPRSPATFCAAGFWPSRVDDHGLLEAGRRCW